ncbi:MAG TPA: APC family permease [Thermoanaerobaculia bacterium]|jgi:APA family basic amino acid/polyamine antiporter|nr:APC family permease [Thermoanaerobaculia bacterium]
MTVSETARARGHLLAVLGVGFGLAVTIGNTIGAGILRTPGVIAGELHTFWPYITIWIAGALYALLGANALSELATLVPRSGGQYVFVRHGLGDYAGFVVGWSDWISTCGTTAAVAIVVGEYTVSLIPQARTQQVVALAVVAIFTIVQWLGVRSGSALQNLTSIVKALALLLFIGACFWFGTRSPMAPTAMTLTSEGPMLLAYVIALQSVIYTYDGWSAVIYFSEEVKDHGRNIPRAMLSGVVSVTIIYLLINLAFLTVVALPTIAGSNFAAGIVVDRIFGAAGQNLLRALVVLILLSAVSSNVLMAPRVVYAMARDGLFWRGAREVNRGGTPDVALMISSMLAAAFIVTNTFETVIAILAFFFVANYTLSFVTLFALRRREPDAPRPYRAWGHPFTTILAILASLAFLGGAVASDTKSSLFAIGLLVASVPVYLIVKRMHR